VQRAIRSPQIEAMRRPAAVDPVNVTWENDTHLWFKRAKSSEALLGDGAWHREMMMRAWADDRSAAQ
jgi:hypothetical protein